LAGGGAVLRVLKTIGHRGTETQRKAKAVFGFLCASVSLWLMVFSWGSGLLRRVDWLPYGLPRRFAPRNDDFEDLASGGAVLRVLKTVGHRGTETQRKAKAVFGVLCASVSLWLMVFLWANDDSGGFARLRCVFTPMSDEFVRPTVLKG
jgi:hypothetical protein